MAGIKHHRANSKVQELCQRVRDLALHEGPRVQLPTVREMCDLFETNRVMLLQALDLLEAQHVIYRKKRQGIFVSPFLHRKSFCVLLDVSTILNVGTSPFWSILWGRCDEEVQRRSSTHNEFVSFHLIARSAQRTMVLPEDVRDRIQAGLVHGVVAIGITMDLASWIQDQHIPCVSFAGPGSSIVIIDTLTETRMAVESLREQGCRRIAYWEPAAYRNDAPAISRFEEMEFFKVLSEYGLPFDPGLVRNHLHHPHLPTNVDIQAILQQEQGYRAVIEQFGDVSTEKPDGIFIADDIMTNGALIAMQRLGIRLGTDVKVATHANVGSTMLFGYTDFMTLLEFDPSQIARVLFERLDALIAGQKVDFLYSLKPTIRYPVQSTF